MQPSNAHVVRFIELAPELRAGAGGIHLAATAGDGAEPSPPDHPESD